MGTKSSLGKFKYQSNTISDYWKKPALFLTIIGPQITIKLSDHLRLIIH